MRVAESLLGIAATRGGAPALGGSVAAAAVWLKVGMGGESHLREVGAP